MEKRSDKLDKWQRRLSDSETEYQALLDKMDRREELYQGIRKLKPLTDRDMFNAAWNDFVAWFAEKYRPADGYIDPEDIL